MTAGMHQTQVIASLSQELRALKRVNNTLSSVRVLLLKS